MKKIGIILPIILLVALAAGLTFAVGFFVSKNIAEEQVFCTQEAMVCPDGSYVGRQGPKCEFAPCPSEALCEGGNCPEVVAKTTGTIKGKVEVGPICPVERIPPDPNCQAQPEHYTSREVILYAADGKTLVKKMNFLSDGTYSFEVSPGTYVIDTPAEGIGGSGDVPEKITVKKGETIEFNFSIDTGIR